MSTRHKLPVTLQRPPQGIDLVRQRLGGRGQSLAGVGEIVQLRRPDGTVRTGVILFATDDHFDVWIGAGQVLRVRRSEIEPADTNPPRDFVLVASDARVFSTLNEGESVHFNVSATRHDEGTLAEKCRYGAIVKRGDGTLVGVGFQKLWPAANGAAN